MEPYFDLFLKGVTSVVILYIAFNTIFRYHPSIRLVDLVAIVVFTVISFLFIGSSRFVAYAIIIGVVLALYLGTKFFFRKKNIDFVMLYSFSRHDQDMLFSAVRETESKHTILKQEISFVRNLRFLFKINGTNKKNMKKFLHELDLHLAKKPKRFGFYQYFHIIFALILMAAIWRF